MGFCFLFSHSFFFIRFFFFFFLFHRSRWRVLPLFGAAERASEREKTPSEIEKPQWKLRAAFEDTDLGTITDGRNSVHKSPPVLPRGYTHVETQHVKTHSLTFTMPFINIRGERRRAAILWHDALLGGWKRERGWGLGVSGCICLSSHCLMSQTKMETWYLRRSLICLNRAKGSHKTGW